MASRSDQQMLCVIERLISRWRRVLFSLGALLLGLTAQQTTAQTAASLPAPPAQFDPSDVYFQGWLLSQDSEALVKEEQFLEALEKLRRAKQLFETVERTFPEWKSDMVAGRLSKTTKQIAEVTPGALRQQDEKQRAVAELEGGAQREITDQGAATAQVELSQRNPASPLPRTPPPPTIESSRIAELQTEVAGLRKQLSSAPDSNQLKKEIGALKRQIETAPDARALESELAKLKLQLEAMPDPRTIERQRDLSIAQLRKARAELDRLRRQSVEAPVQDELRALSRRIEGLDSEKSAMGQALEQSQAETTQAKAQIGALQQERGRLMQEVADLKRNLETERATANEVVQGQRQQLEQFQTQLQEKDTALATATQKIQSLETQLTEVRESLTDMSDERDQLMRERDSMANLLKLNEAGQLQQVIDQNLALDRELRESTQRYDALQENNDATKHDLLEALRDLAISKRRIQLFRKEKNEQDARMNELQARLKEEQQSLATSGGDKNEVEMLKGIIQRQLKIQEKRHEARELLLTTLDEKAEQNEDIRRAMNIFKGADLNLSPEELEVLKDQHVDGVIVSTYAQPREEVDRNLARLEGELAPFRKAGSRAFQNGRLHAAREAFEMVIEKNAGDSVSMCKLGLVEYKLGELAASADMFRRACEIDPRNPYAHRMLGHTLARIGETDEARSALEKSIELAPTNAEGHLLIGNLHAREGNLQAAEESFGTASACEETLYEPHYNLAVLLANAGRNDDALSHYSQSLQRGGPTNLELEKELENRP